MIPYTNPWNKVYRLAAGKRKNITQITTLRKPDGSQTAYLHETLKHMLEHFTPEDNHNNYSDFHKQARILSQEWVDTKDDKDFTVEEIRNAVASMGDKKAPGEDGITGKIYKCTLEILPNYITALYNRCLRRGVFPTRWKRAKLIPITKPERENSDEVSKFRPISLLNVGGKVREKVLINRINHHVFSHAFMNTHQYGFTPQKGTIDAAMEVKKFVKEGLAAGEVIILISLDVKGAFDAAFWPTILNGLRACGCPKNLYDVTTSYFSQRTAILSTNSIRLEKQARDACKGPPAGRAYGTYNITVHAGNKFVNMFFEFMPFI